MRGDDIKGFSAKLEINYYALYVPPSVRPRATGAVILVLLYRGWFGLRSSLILSNLFLPSFAACILFWVWWFPSFPEPRELA